MATLKIVADKTHLIMDVAQIVVHGHFECGPNGDPFEAAKRQGKLIGLCHSSVDFEGMAHGISIGVRVKTDTEYSNWLVPVRSCFLMADNGRTIDRI